MNRGGPSSLGEYMWELFYVEAPQILNHAKQLDVEGLIAGSAPEKAQVAERLAKLGPPPHFRLIDCKSSFALHKVVLVDWEEGMAFTAVSHTWGQDVYEIFDCECACECTSTVPRHSAQPCPGPLVHGERYKVVVGDILTMSTLLMAAGSDFVWHDGVCIGQHNNAEVKEAILHMGWIYSNAADTVIFLDYVGKPMALLQLVETEPHLMIHTRWNRRVWTLQEAVLSRRRRYCIRCVPITANPPDSWEEFEAKLAHCYGDDSCIAVIEEKAFWAQLISLNDEVLRSINECLHVPTLDKALTCLHSLQTWIKLLDEHFFQFPNLAQVLYACARDRHSKHEGDRINSILGLAGITNFVAPKDDDLETSTIEFFKRLGPEGLRLALFWINDEWKDDGKRHTWLPCLSRRFLSVLLTRHTRVKLPEASPIRYALLENGMLELEGPIWCVPVQFTIRRSNAELPPLVDILNHEKMVAVDLSVFDWGNPSFECFASASNTRFGKAILPWLSETESGRMLPVIEGCPLEDGSSFSAHLLFGPFHLATELIRDCTPALIIKGDDLRAPVSRLGYFKANHILCRFICGMRTTDLNQLVIN